MLHKALAGDAQVKMSDSGSGTVEMYLSTFLPWDNVRPVPERPLPGAFTPYLDDFKRDGFLTYAHEWNTRIPAGTWVDAYEDSVGLKAIAEFHSTTAAQDIRQTVLERMQRGKSVKTSIAYRVLKDEYVEMDDPALRAEGIPRGRNLLALPLYEGSIVPVPANPAANVTAIKGWRLRRPSGLLAAVKAMMGDGEDDEGDPDEEAAETPDQEAQEVLCCLLAYIREQRMLQAASPLTLMLVSNDLRAATDVVQTLLANAATAPMDGMMAALPPGKSSPALRLPFTVEAALVETAARGLVDRVRHRADVRLKEGRMLSAANRGKLEPMPATLRDLADMLDEMLTASAPPAKADPIDLSAEYLRFLRLEARLNGVLV